MQEWTWCKSIPVFIHIYSGISISDHFIQKNLIRTKKARVIRGGGQLGGTAIGLK